MLNFEKPLIYFILIILVLIDILGKFFPSIKNIPTSDPFTIIFLILLLMFRYMDERFSRIILSPKVYDDFNSAMSEIFNNTTHIDKIDFFGSTGGLFQPTLSSRNIQVNRLRVLIRDPDSNQTYDFPNTIEDQNALKERSKLKILDWIKMKEAGSIKNFEIKKYNFAPSFFAVIVNDKKGFWGFFRQGEIYPYFHVMQSRVISNDSFYEKSVLNNIIKWYKDIFDNHAEPFELK